MGIVIQPRPRHLRSRTGISATDPAARLSAASDHLARHRRTGQGAGHRNCHGGADRAVDGLRRARCAAGSPQRRALAWRHAPAGHPFRRLAQRAAVDPHRLAHRAGRRLDHFGRRRTGGCDARPRFHDPVSGSVPRHRRRRDGYTSSPRSPSCSNSACVLSNAGLCPGPAASSGRPRLRPGTYARMVSRMALRPRSMGSPSVTSTKPAVTTLRSLGCSPIDNASDTS